ncbi:MAG TPA: sugar phosphate nucleotidyltransferase [Thermoanaerobaculia bacterium]|nr:sugar phosphate nucleotidyltransferase [Thermoanaerobaculia bacterium]
MKAMVLAAGYGTRFRPITYRLPKPLIPLCNRPLIGWALDSLEAAGALEVVVNLHHLSDPLAAWIEQEIKGRLPVHFSHEEKILGTGGGIRRARRWLESDEGFFVVNADTFQQPPLRELERRRREEGALAALLLRHPPASDRFTPVGFDGHRVTGIGEVPEGSEAVMFAGSHTTSSRIFTWIPDRDFSGITEDVYLPLIRSNQERIAGLIDDGLWFDVGTPLRYLEASAAIRERMISGAMLPPAGSRISDSSLVDDRAEIAGSITASVVGSQTRIAAGGSVAGSILWDRVEIPTGARVESSLIAHDAKLPPSAQLRNVLVCLSAGLPGNEGFEVRDGLAIVPLDPSSPHMFRTG